MNKTAAFSYNDFASVVRYDPESGKFFRLKRGRRGQPAGSEVTGAINSTGYVVINFFQRPTLAHRIAWLLRTGSWPVAQIDHINRVRTDNRWVNLRPASISQNNANALKTKQRTLPAGVRLNRNKTNPFMAIISVNNKSLYLGSFPNPEAAHQTYLASKQKYHGPFNLH